MIEITDQNREIWQDLFTAAEAFRDFKPWKKIDEEFLFGVQDPASGMIGWCVVMGVGEELFGLVVNLGDEGYHAYLDILCSHFIKSTNDEIELVINQKCLKVDFVNRDDTNIGDLELYKQLNRTYEGKNMYPVIRSVEPGYFPWFIDDEQAEFLKHCLNQSVDLYKMVLNGKVHKEEPETDNIPVMVPKMTGKKIQWKIQYMESPDPEDEPELIPNTFLVNRIKKQCSIKPETVLCLLLHYFKNPVQDDDLPPFFPKLLLWVDGMSGMIVNTKLVSPADFWNDFQNNFTDTLIQLGYIPEMIGVDSEEALDLLQNYCDELGIDLVFDPDQPLFEELKESLEDFLSDPFE